jgi:hypothetical protein
MSALPLTDLQRGLRDLIKGRPTTAGHEYLRRVAASPALDIVREITTWWRALGLERFAPLTSALLRHEGRFDEIAYQLTVSADVSPFHDQLTASFLDTAAADADELVAAVARFERALHAIAHGGRPGTTTIEWPQDPYLVLDALLHGSAVPRGGGETYRVDVAPSAEGAFTVTRSATVPPSINRSELEVTT